MNLDDYEQMVDVDLKIDKSALDDDSSRTPQLHSKYLKFFAREQLAIRKLESDLAILIKEKREYYLGQASPETYQEKPFDLKVLRGDLDIYMAADQDIIRMKDRISYKQVIINFLERTLNSINNRNWTIRNILEFYRFTNGNV